MPNAKAKPLHALAASELTKAHDFLFEADILIAEVKALFLHSGDFAAAARLKDILGRLADEMQTVERVIAGRHSGLASLQHH